MITASRFELSDQTSAHTAVVRPRRHHPSTLRATIVVLGGVAFSPGLSLAQPLPAHLSYHALDSECPSREQFLGHVQAQLVAPGPTDTEDPRQFSISVGSRKGILEVRDETGPTATRVIDGEDCTDTAGALAFSTAMILREPPPKLPVAWQWSFGAGALGLFSVVPDPAFGPVLFANLSPVQRQSGWPDLGLGAAYARTSASYTYGAEWEWGLLRAEVCPLVAKMYGLETGVCVALDVGAIRSEGTALSIPHSEWRIWLAPAAGLRLSWRPLSSLAIELNASVLFPASRYRYTENRETMDLQPSVWEVPNFGQTLIVAIRYGRRDQTGSDRR